jgi:hypothetical protein
VADPTTGSGNVLRLTHLFTTATLSPRPNGPQVSAFAGPLDYTKNLTVRLRLYIPPLPNPTNAVDGLVTAPGSSIARLEVDEIGRLHALTGTGRVVTGTTPTFGVWHTVQVDFLTNGSQFPWFTVLVDGIPATGFLPTQSPFVGTAVQVWADLYLYMDLTAYWDDFLVTQLPP